MTRHIRSAVRFKTLVSRWLDQVGEHDRAERTRVYRIALRDRAAREMIVRETLDYAALLDEHEK